MTEALFWMGEKVLVPHVDKHYEAKILKAELRADGIWYYYLHYMGWNKKWDEWVEESGLQKALPDAGLGHKKLYGKANGFVNGHTHVDPIVKSRKRKEEEMSDFYLQVELDVPAVLKKQLLDEWEVVSQQGRYLPLPRTPNAMDVLRQFVEFGGSSRCAASDLQELATGIEEYLDKSLQDHLLYKSEWEEADELLKDGTSASAVYGAEHLLRLLVNLSDIVPAGVVAHHVNSLHARLQDLVNFLVVNRHAFFAKFSEYRFRSQPSHRGSENEVAALHV